MILERTCSLKLEELEPVLRRVARRYRAALSAVEPVGSGLVFTVLQPELHTKLLSAEMRFAAILPTRMVAYPESGRLTMAAASPVEFGRAIDRPDLENLASSVEALMTDIFEEVSRPVTMAAGSGGEAPGAWGATEDHVNMRAALPQRIDNRGSKVEDLAGTGEHDSQGG